MAYSASDYTIKRMERHTHPGYVTLHIDHFGNAPDASHLRVKFEGKVPVKIKAGSFKFQRQERDEARQGQDFRFQLLRSCEKAFGLEITDLAACAIGMPQHWADLSVPMSANETRAFIRTANRLYEYWKAAPARPDQAVTAAPLSGRLAPPRFLEDRRTEAGQAYGVDVPQEAPIYAASAQASSGQGAYVVPPQFWRGGYAGQPYRTQYAPSQPVRSNNAAPAPKVISIAAQPSLAPSPAPVRTNVASTVAPTARDERAAPGELNILQCLGSI